MHESSKNMFIRPWKFFCHALSNLLYLFSDWQNYLRAQAGNTTSVNLVICTVDYLLRLQESMMDFYWYYSRKDIIDPAGKSNFFKAIGVASQVGLC